MKTNPVLAVFAYLMLTTGISANGADTTPNLGRNWGEAISGIQMSIAISTNQFRVGETINATVTIRNVTTNPIVLPGPPYASIKLVVGNEHTNAMPIKSRLLKVSEPKSVVVPGQGQLTYSFSLERMFNLKTPGAYYATAMRPVPGASDQTPSASSGTVSFTLTHGLQ